MREKGSELLGDHMTEVDTLARRLPVRGEVLVLYDSIDGALILHVDISCFLKQELGGLVHVFGELVTSLKNSCCRRSIHQMA